MYFLKDTFNDRIISRHRTLKAAAKAWNDHDRRVELANGHSSYIPKAVLIERDGEQVALDDSEADELLELRNQWL